MTLSYKNALITGASSGLGRGLARWFAAQGVHVYGAARRESELASLAEECAKAGGTFEPVPLDVAQTHAAIEQMREALEAAKRRLLELLVRPRREAGHG